MSKTTNRYYVQRIGTYLCNNIPYADIEIRKELLQCLGDLADELGIDFVEYCNLLEDKYEIKGPIRN